MLTQGQGIKGWSFGTGIQASRLPTPEREVIELQIMGLEKQFGYRLRRTEGGWAWTAFDTSGEAQARGEAPSKALAAAALVQALAAASLPDGEAEKSVLGID